MKEPTDIGIFRNSVLTEQEDYAGKITLVNWKEKKRRMKEQTDVPTSNSPLENIEDINPHESAPSAEFDNMRFSQFYATAAVNQAVTYTEIVFVRNLLQNLSVDTYSEGWLMSSTMPINAQRITLGIALATKDRNLYTALRSSL